MPVGVPDKSTLSTYGGPLVDAYPVVNPNTDQDASAGNQQAADTAGMTRTATRCWARFTTASTTGGMTVVNWDAVYGEVNTNAPPTPARTTTGVFTIVFPTTITDSLGVVHTINLQRGGVIVEGVTLLFAQVQTIAANGMAIQLYSYSSGFNLSDSPGTILHVWMA
jgi:hypothetical protein